MRKLLLPLFAILMSVALISMGQESNLPVCNQSELQVLSDDIIPNYENMLRLAIDVQSLDALYIYIDAQLLWREDWLSQLPACAEAVQIGMLMNQVASDLSTMWALGFAGMTQDENPYTESISDSVNQYGLLKSQIGIVEVVEALPTVSTVTKTYYVISNGSVNIRSCDSTDCAVVTTAKRGDALTVVDDSGSWYQLQLSNAICSPIIQQNHEIGEFVCLQSVIIVAKCAKLNAVRGFREAF